MGCFLVLKDTICPLLFLCPIFVSLIKIRHIKHISEIIKFKFLSRAQQIYFKIGSYLHHSFKRIPIKCWISHIHSHPFICIFLIQEVYY